MKFILTVVLLLIVQLGHHLAGANIRVERSQVYCHSPAFLIYEELVTAYLKGYRSITIMVGSGVEDNAVMEAIKCKYDQLLHSSYKLYTVDNYLKLVDEDRANPAYGYQPNPYPYGEAFHCEANKSVTTEKLLPAIAFRNPIARVILLIRGIAKHDMLQLFRVAWFEYKLLNILLLSRVDARTLMVCLFNPYLTEPSVLDERNLFCHRLRVLADVFHFNKQVNRFIRDRIRNLHQYPLRIAITDVELMSKAVHFQNNSISHYQYLDGEMVEIMRQRMNFSIQYIELNYQESVGFITSNGSLGGTLAMIEHNTIDLAANSRTIMQHPMRNLLYVHFLCPIRLVFVVPINYYANRFKLVFFHRFSLQMYLTNFGLSLVLPLLLVALIRRDLSIGAYLKEAFRTLAILFATSVRLPRDHHRRLVLMGLMFYSIVAYSAWQGMTIIQLNKDEEKLRNIHTLDELLDSSLQLKAILSFGNVIRSKIWNGTDVRGRLAVRIEVQTVPSNISIIPLVADNRTAAVPIIEYFTDVVKARYFDPVRKESKLYSIPQPLVEYMTAMALPKNSPLFPSIRRITMNCVENGIVHYQLSLIRTKGMLLQIAQNRNKTLRPDPQTRQVKLFNMRNVFLVYIVMNGLSIVVFCLELHRFHRAVSRQRKKRQGRKERAHRVERSRSIVWPYVE
ncbi:uncharacterized protein LOC126575280 [Anopheles aquasalis]|uniref:uncharacterized protein LOC126575280 n=1 Tax=Anopheles aquasalis TaxID=42839 RepID=UPI00215B6F07|nr:uncharacterized protein LOC126575280 [Anopheles aquasalis]